LQPLTRGQLFRIVVLIFAFIRELPPNFGAFEILEGEVNACGQSSSRHDSNMRVEPLPTGLNTGETVAPHS
jgi:hypothetical protein